MSGARLTEKPLVIRADADSRMGAGHVMRCLALGQAWQDAGGRPLFLVAPAPPALETRLLSEGMEVLPLEAAPGTPEDARETASLARSRGADWVAADGYHFGADYQRLIKDSGLRLLCIDDYGHAGHYCADLVLNQNIHATEDLYPSREANTRLLLGTRYVLLRREFWPWRGWRREIPAVARKVLVTLGGGDPDNVTLKIIRALAQVEVADLEAVVVVGPANPHLAELQAAVQAAPPFIRLESNVTNMPELMAWADVAITAGGSTCWETAFMGLPALTIILADNQRPVSEQLGKSNLAYNLGWHKDVSSNKIAHEIVAMIESRKRRKEMSLEYCNLVDGKGANRVFRLLLEKILRLRKVQNGDCRLLYQWANDPEVRKFAFSPEYICWEEHKAWFNNKMHNPKCIQFIAVNERNEPVGQVRFDIQENNEAEIDISVDKNLRGLGVGSTILSLAINNLLINSPITKFNAFILIENLLSINLFEIHGFSNIGITTINGKTALHLLFMG